ncbi:MAG: hypothetical protein ACRET2_09795 [Steroidobacteraceae bacterium]
MRLARRTHDRQECGEQAGQRQKRTGPPYSELRKQCLKIEACPFCKSEVATRRQPTLEFAEALYAQSLSDTDPARRAALLRQASSLVDHLVPRSRDSPTRGGGACGSKRRGARRRGLPRASSAHPAATEGR